MGLLNEGVMFGEFVFPVLLLALGLCMGMDV